MLGVSFKFLENSLGLLSNDTSFSEYIQCTHVFLTSFRGRAARKLGILASCLPNLLSLIYALLMPRNVAAHRSLKSEHLWCHNRVANPGNSSRICAVLFVWHRENRQCRFDTRFHVPTYDKDAQGRSTTRKRVARFILSSMYPAVYLSM